MTTWVEEFHDFAGGNNGNTNQFGAMATGGVMKRSPLLTLFSFQFPHTIFSVHLCQKSHQEKKP
jgi:hypothetical protein